MSGSHHDHGHGGHGSHGGLGGLGVHVHAPASYGRAFAIGITLNLGFVLVEAWYGYVADSVALLADAGHNLSDVLGLVVAWTGTVLARRKASARFTYGLRGATILAALAKADFDSALALARQLPGDEAPVIAQLAVCGGGLTLLPSRERAIASDESDTGCQEREGRSRRGARLE